jgi:3-hydroxy-5-methyl-1-naphthoate 3-O-methyltransferase
MPERASDPAPIMGLATGYWASQCLLTANRVGLFELLAPEPLRAESVAARLGLAERPTRLLLKACVGLGLLEEDEGAFANHPRSQAFLVPGSRGHLGNAVRYGDDMWEAWGQLEAALRDGVPPVRPSVYTGVDAEKTRHFVHAMHDRALGIGRALVGMVDLSGSRRLLDVGGGPGTYSALFVDRHQELRATVLDLPEVVALADEILESMGAGDRVEATAGDYRTAEFPGGNDAVLISGVFHRETEPMCRDLIRRAGAALQPGGRLIISDVFTDDDGATPVFAALFGLNMMLSAPDGGVHADSEVARWMEEEEFRDVERRPFPPPMPHRVVTGIR